jgi:DNA-directed RNA polymerase specialized sigma24 family protein
MSFWDRKHTSQSFQTLSDESLCREAKKGCYEAYLVLFDRYWRQVFRLAHAVLHDDGEAKVVAQALFLEVHRNMLRFDPERGSFRLLLLRPRLHVGDRSETPP